jgi:serine/threonine protein kinase
MLVGDLNLEKCLGKGAFGEVYLTTKKGSKLKYATKKIDKSVMKNPKSKEYLENEINILKEMDHPNIIKLIEVKDTTKYYYLVMEYCNGGDLSKCLAHYKNKNQKAFSEEVVQYLMRQIVSGICYLHKKNILHRDIKLENILVNFDNIEDARQRNMMKAKIKIIDFGFSRHLQKCELAYSILGNPINMEPGILKKLNKNEHNKDYGYDQKADIWGLGTICYEMLIGKCTFDSESMKELVNKVERGNYFLPSSLSKEAISFLNGMIQYDPKKRLNAEQLLNHRFLKRPYSELTKINLKEAQNKLIGSNIKINSKYNQSIWEIFEQDEDSELDNITSDMIERDTNIESNESSERKNNDTTYDSKSGSSDHKNIEIKHKGNENIESDKYKNKNKIIDEKDINEQFSEALDFMNNDFIYIEPLLIPFIPGDDPLLINKVSESSEDCF